MSMLIVYADPDTLDQRSYQLDADSAGDAFVDALDSIRADAFQHDLGVTPAAKPAHNVVGRIRAIPGVSLITQCGGSYTVFKQEQASWATIDPAVREILGNAFGPFDPVNVINGPLVMPEVADDDDDGD